MSDYRERAAIASTVYISSSAPILHQLVRPIGPLRRCFAPRFSLSSVSYLCFHASLLNARLDCFAATTAHILFRYLEAQEYIGGLLLCNQGFFFPLLKAGID